MPRRIVALGVGFALLLIGLTAPAAFARETLIHDGQSGSQNPFARFAAASGSTLVRTTDVTTGYNGFLPAGPGAMSRYGCVVLPVNNEAIDAYRIAALKTYAQGGGTVVLIGEYHTFRGGTPLLVLNDVAVNMGATMSLDQVTADFGPSETTSLGTHPLTDGVTSIGYNATTTVTLGERGVAIARTSLNQPFIGVEQIGAGRLVMVGDSNVLIDSPYYDPPYGNATFVRNMCGDLSPPDIVIFNPVPNARYKLNRPNVKAVFSCSDEDDRLNPFYSDILYCTGTPYANGAVIDTSVEGGKQLTVDASDKAGNLATKSVNYTVDGTAPVPVITVPANADYTRRDTYPADFGCINNDGDPVLPTVTAATTPLGAAINTSDTGVQTFSITCTDSVGNSASLTREYTVIDRSPPDITITSPADGARYRLNQAINALYGCSDEDGPADLTPPGFCTGPVANGGNVPTGVAGSQQFTVNAQDQAGNPATKTHTYVVDASPPDITIVKPAANARYNKGVQLIADYTCSDPDTTETFNDVKSCVGPVPNGETIDTSAAGSRTFKVDTQDQAGNAGTKTHTYTILGTSPPTVTIASPADGATFKIGAAIPFSYSCADPDGPQDIRSCTRVGGSGPLDSSKAGTFEVTARVEDFADNVRTKTHKYTVSANPAAPTAGAAPTKSTSTKVCKSRRSFTVRVKRKKGVRIKSATITVNGKLQKAKKGKRFTGKVVLVGLKKGRYSVVIRVKLTNGKTVTDRRRFKTCTPKGK